jgi:hypothetical protein
MILSLGCQHDLSKDLHLVDKLLKVWMDKSAHDGGNEYIFITRLGSYVS